MPNSECRYSECRYVECCVNFFTILVMMIGSTQCRSAKCRCVQGRSAISKHLSLAVWRMLSLYLYCDLLTEKMLQIK